MNWKKNFEKGKKIILATASNNKEPNANIVIAKGFYDKKLLVIDCQMDTTIRNLKNNNKICVIGGYYKLLGYVEIFDSGKYFDISVENSNGDKVNNAILITIEKVFDLDKAEMIESSNL